MIDTQHPGCLIYWDLRAAVRPATTERQVHSQSKLTGFFGGEAKSLDEFVGQKRQILDTGTRFVECKGIDRLHFEAANSTLFQKAHFAFDFLPGNGWPEPPPSHHYAGFVGRALKGTLKIGKGRTIRRSGCAGAVPSRIREEQDKTWEE